MARKPEIAFGAVDEALSNVLRDVLRSLALPSEVVDGVGQMRLAMLQHQDKLPRLCRVVLAALEGNGTVESKISGVVTSVGKTLGWDNFTLNMNLGIAQARVERLRRERPDLYAALPAVIERGKAELRKLV